MPDGSPYDLTDKEVIFNEHKANDKYIVDTNVQGVDKPHGSISYQLHPQAYAASGTAWFEIQDASGNVVDSTQDFYLNVEDAANASIYNSNYIYKLDSLRDQLQDIVDSSDTAYQAELQKMADGLTQKLADMQTAYDASDKQWQAAFQQSEQSRADDYTAEKNKRLADDTANANAFTAAQNKRDSDFANQQATINKAASDQRDTITQQWSAEQTQLVNDWTTKRTALDTELSQYESTVTSLQAAVDKLNKTDLPDAQQKMDALNAEIQKAEQTFSQVDFTKFATTDELETKADKADVYTKTDIDGKVNIFGPLFRQIQNSNTWEDIFGTNDDANLLTSLRINPGGSGSLLNNYAIGIGFGGVDTKGVLSVAFEHPQARITAGAGTGPSWSEDIAWKSDLTGYAKTVSLNGGTKAAPDSGGNIDLTVPQPDLTGYAKTADVNGQFTTVNNQIKELQSSQSTFTPITQADYDNLTDAQKTNGMYAIIG